MIKILFYFMICIFTVSLFFACSTDITDNSDDIDTVTVYKPNIYLYLEFETSISIILEFPNGGAIVESIPEYQSEWNVNIEPGGLIENEYSYLFYECTIPDLFQYQKGWIIRQDSLETFFTKNLSAYGFRGQEIMDFIDYWIPILDYSEEFLIYPQLEPDINRIILFKYTPQPDNHLRLFYVIKENNKNLSTLPIPEIPDFTRNGFYVVEWGVQL